MIDVSDDKARDAASYSDARTGRGTLPSKLNLHEDKHLFGLGCSC
jgi:hypothetical protein